VFATAPTVPRTILPRGLLEIREASVSVLGYAKGREWSPQKFESVRVPMIRLKRDIQFRGLTAANLPGVGRTMPRIVWIPAYRFRVSRAGDPAPECESKERNVPVAGASGGYFRYDVLVRHGETSAPFADERRPGGMVVRSASLCWHRPRRFFALRGVRPQGSHTRPEIQQRDTGLLTEFFWNRWVLLFPPLWPIIRRAKRRLHFLSATNTHGRPM